jgi:GNAT superfamily N-acetyltransferase
MVTIREVDAARWDDLCELFGPSGAYSGCWCMWWRISGREFSANGNAGNRAALESLAREGKPVGLIAYVGQTPVGWASVAPRTDFSRITRSPQLKPVDAEDADVWSVPCFFIHRGHRGDGIATALLRNAIKYARGRRAKALEGYPVDPHGVRKPNADLFTGTVSLFEKAGFEKTRDAGQRVVMVKKL